MLWHYLLTGYLLLLPFTFALNPTPGIDLSLSRVLAPVIFLVWLFQSLKDRSVLIDRRPRFWLFTVFLFLACISIFWAIDETRALKKILFLFPFFSLYFPVYDATRDLRLRTRMCKALFAGTFLAAVLGLFQFLLQFILGLQSALLLLAKTTVPFFQGANFGKLILEYPSWLVNINGRTIMRAFGSFPDPHLFSLYLNLALPLGIWLYLKEKRWWYLAGSTFIMLASLFSFSRAAYLSLAGGIIFFLMFSSILNVVRKKPATFFLVGLVIFLVGITPNPISQRFYASFNIKEGSNSGRLAMWKKGLEITGHYPLTGVGLGNFSRYIEPQSEERNPIYAHNLLIDFASETGIFSALALLFALVAPIIDFLQTRTLPKKIIAASFAIFLIQNIFETPFYSVHVFPLVITLLAFNTHEN